jgi:hypothetical protein
MRVNGLVLSSGSGRVRLQVELALRLMRWAGLVLVYEICGILTASRILAITDWLTPSLYSIPLPFTAQFFALNLPTVKAYLLSVTD